MSTRRPYFQPIHRAARLIREGGVVAYPTEGVFGLGCMPDDVVAVARILKIKRRDPEMGLLLIAASAEQLDEWIDVEDAASRLASSAERPVTWIVPASDRVPYWITGRHSGVGVRITSHPVAAALCDAAGSAIVSTSANLAGQRPARNRWILRRRFHDLVDFIVPGRCGPAAGPSEIRVLDSDEIIRQAGQA